MESTRVPPWGSMCHIAWDEALRSSQHLDQNQYLRCSNTFVSKRRTLIYAHFQLHMLAIYKCSWQYSFQHSMLYDFTRLPCCRGLSMSILAALCFAAETRCSFESLHSLPFVLSFVLSTTPAVVANPTFATAEIWLSKTSLVWTEFLARLVTLFKVIFLICSWYLSPSCTSCP